MHRLLLLSLLLLSEGTVKADLCNQNYHHLTSTATNCSDFTLTTPTHYYLVKVVKQASG